MDQNRVPKGTPRTGGQFAQDRKPDGGDLVTPCNNGFSSEHQYDENHRCGWCGAFEPGHEMRREAVVDTEIAAAYDKMILKASRVEASESQLRYLIPNSMRTRDDIYMVIDGKYEVVSVEGLRTMFEAGEIGPKDGYNHDVYVRGFATYDERKAEFDAARADYLEKDERYEGWSRFFLVPGGHIHSSMNCSTCNKDGKRTEFGWLPELSGLNEADAVAAHGAVLCTVCYPSAPVEYTNQFDLDKAAKAEKRCARSGVYVGGRTRGTVCTECGTWVSITSSGKLRAHDRPAT